VTTRSRRAPEMNTPSETYHPVESEDITLAPGDPHEVASGSFNILPRIPNRTARTQPQRARQKESISSTDSSRSVERKRSANGIRKCKKPFIDTEKPEKIEEAKKCCICLDVPNISEASSLNGCAHVFCFGCIEKWAERENSCPLCKNRFTKIERVTKPPAKKRKKGDPPRAKQTKKIQHRDQRTDFITANPLQSLFASFEGEHARLRPFTTEIIFSGIHARNGRRVSRAGVNRAGAGRATRSNRSRAGGVGEDRSWRVQEHSGRRIVTEEERQYLQQFSQLLASNGPYQMGGSHSRLLEYAGDPFQPGRGGSSHSTDSDGPSEDNGSFTDRLRAVIEGLNDVNNREGSDDNGTAGFHISFSHSGGETAATAIEIDDSDGDELN